MKRAIFVALISIACVTAQTPAFKQFKIEPVDSAGSFANHLSSEQIDANRVALRDLIAFVYEIPPTQVTGPGWLDDRYGISAKPRDGQEDGFLVALRKAIGDRLHLRVERENKEMQVSVSRLASPGSSKMRPGGGASKVSGSNGSLEAEGMTRSHFEGILTRLFGHSVIDETGLPEGYSFHLDWEPDNVASLTKALQDQLGLTVSDERRRMEVLVVSRSN